MPTICTRTITELCGMKFVIPSYQRGYRWRDIQVEQLLNDLWEFYQGSRAKAGAWYCLQPLVVVPIDDESPAATVRNANVLPCGRTVSSGRATQDAWTVIDGQQRLTTLFIILSQLGRGDPWRIEYETRQNSGDFLRDLTSGNDTKEWASNPDYFCMKNAANTVAEWLTDKEQHPEFDKSVFAEHILVNAKFIWYETAEDHYDVFIRLNSGKISLSNAELIKALLLRENRFSDTNGTVKLQQLEIAGEWDRIEQALGNDEFWYFVNPDAQSSRFHATRIDFLFELVFRKGFVGLSQISDYLIEIKKNPYLGFAKFADFCKSHSSENPEKIVWSEIQYVFRRIKSWYDDRSLYHYVGFLMNRKGEETEIRFIKLVAMLTLSETQTRCGFLIRIRKQCSDAVTSDKKFDELEYGCGSDNGKLNDVLLLFNLALLNRQNSEQSRYPFKTHTGTAWSLEHVHAKQERELTENDIKCLKNEYCSDQHSDLHKALKEAFNGTVKLEHPQTDDGKEVSDKWVLKCEGQDTHGLGNLALLERKQNSTFNNKLYPEKRRIFAEWEQGTNKDEQPDFIPLGTKMTFFKHFSLHNSASFVWDSTDSNAYLDTIVKTVADYVGVKGVDLLSRSDNNK